MLKEAIDYLVNLTRDGDKANVITVPNVRRKSLLILRGTPESYAHDPPRREHTTEDLDSLIHIATRYKDACSVWHSEEKVAVMLEDEWRDDSATFKLTKSEAWNAALSLSKPHHQADIIDLLRTELKDVVMESHPELVGLFKNVKFKRRDESAATIDHGRESMGRSLEQEVTGTDKLPEEISLTLRPYPAVESESVVRFVLKVRYQDETFAFNPVADDVSAAIDAAQEVIAERFRGVTDKVYYGTPWPTH